jgi:hypothetical protein
MKGNQLTLKQKSSVASPICCAAAGSGAFSLLVVYRARRAQAGCLWRLRPWKKIIKKRSSTQSKRAQKEGKRIDCSSTGPLEKGTREAQAFEVSKRKGDEETDCTMERTLVELR